MTNAGISGQSFPGYALEENSITDLTAVRNYNIPVEAIDKTIEASDEQKHGEENVEELESFSWL